MYVIREEFTARPGQASKLAALFKDLTSLMPEWKTRIMTDAVGPFNTVVMEVEVEELDAFERMMREYAARADVRDKMKGYAEMYLTGKREVYRIV